jgi:hypothetical protein
MLRFGEEFLAAPYKGREPDILGGMAEVAKGVPKGVFGMAKQIGQEALPPFLRGPQPGKMETASNILNTFMALNPALIPLAMGARGAGETTYKATGRPEIAGGVETALSLLSPSALKKVSGSVRSGFERGEIAQAATEDVMQGEIARAAKGTEAAQGRISTAGQQMVSAAQREQQAEQAGKEAAGTLRAKTALAGTAERRADVAHKGMEEIRTAQMPAPKITELEAGEKIKGPAFAKAGEFSGYYPQAKAARAEQGKTLYNDAFNEAVSEGTVPTGKLAGRIAADLESKGIAAEIVPTRAEMFGKTMLKKINPVEEYQTAYQGVRDQLTQSQFEYLAHGRGTTPGTPGTPALSQEVVRAIAGALKGSKEKGLAVPVDRFEEIIGAGKTPVLTDIPATDGVFLHQRLNGAIQAAKDSKRFDLARELLNYRKYIDEALPKNTAAKLRRADEFWASQYIPFFGAKSELSGIVEKKNPAIIFDRLVKPNDPKPVTQIMSVLSPDGQQALRGAFYHKLHQAAETREGFDWSKLVTEYDKYTPEVKQALLGEQKGDWDKIVGNVYNLQTGAQRNLRAMTQQLKLARDELKTSRTGAESALKAQVQAAGKREAAASGHERAVTNLYNEQQKMDKVLKDMAELQRPQMHRGGGYLRSRKLMLAVFAGIDALKAATGMGNPNIARYMTGDLISLYFLSDPRAINAAQKYGPRGIKALADYMATSYDNPLKAGLAVELANYGRALFPGGGTGDKEK